MTLHIKIRIEAQADLADAARWYERHQSGLGAQFLDEFIAAAHLVSEKPLAYPEIWRSTRRALLQRFPFGIYYRLTDDSAVVVAVLHGSRDPRHWKLRV